MPTLWFRNTGNINWNVASNWSTTADLATPSAALPTSADPVIVGATSGNLDVSSGSRSCASIDFTGYTRTLSGVGSITVSGNITLSPTMTITATGTLIATAATATLTSNGKVWPSQLSLGAGANTYTLADAWTVGHLVTVSANAKTLNGFSITTLGNFTHPVGINGTTTIILGGTGTWSGSIAVANPFVINTTGTITISGSVIVSGASFTHTAGAVITTGSTVTFAGNTFSISTNGMIFENVIMNSGNITCTLNNNITLTGSLSVTATTGTKVINGFTIFIGGSLTPPASGNGFGGTTAIVLNGTGTLAGGSAIGNPVTINTSGAITMTGALLFNGGFTHTSGTTITTGTTVSFGGTQNIDSGTTIWNNVTAVGGSVLTLLRDMNVTGLFTSGGTSKTMNGFNLNCAGGFTSSATLSGTTNIIFTGGTWSGVGSINNNLFVNGGTVTISGSVQCNGNYTWQAGTVVTTGSTITFGGNTQALTFSPSTIWNNVTFSSVTGTYTMLSNMNIAGNFLSSGGASTKVIQGAYTIYVGGNLTVSAGTASYDTTIVMNGTGTWSHTVTLGLSMDLIFDTTGTITLDTTNDHIVGSVTYKPMIKYVKGTIITTGNTLSIRGDITFDTLGMTWNSMNVTSASNYIITLESTLNLIGDLTFSAAGAVTDTFAGDSGFVVAGKLGTVGSGAAGWNLQLTPAITYRAGSLIFNEQDPSFTKLISSTVAGTRATLIIDGGTVSVVEVDFKDIDASGGKTIYTIGGAVTNSVNINSYTGDPLVTRSYAYAV